MSIKQRVIEIVNEIIFESGITQNTLARKIGANQSTFSQSTNPDTSREPKLPIIIGLLKLDKTINPEWLLLGTGEKRKGEKTGGWEQRCKACEEKLRMYEYVINNEVPQVAEELGIYKKKDNK